MVKLADVLLSFAGFGFAGWILENAICKERRFSSAFSGEPVPFLPVYAVGGAALAVLSPRIKDLNPIVRAGVYGGTLSALEFVACQVDRRTLDACNWDYSGQNCAVPLEGCVDAPHAFLWMLMGLAAEAFHQAHK